MASQPDSMHTRYANVFRVGRNEHELILDFGQAFVEGAAEAFHTRIITAPAHGAALLDLLAEAIAGPGPGSDIPSPAPGAPAP